MTLEEAKAKKMAMLVHELLKEKALELCAGEIPVYSTPLFTEKKWMLADE